MGVKRKYHLTLPYGIKNGPYFEQGTRSHVENPTSTKSLFRRATIVLNLGNLSPLL